MKLKLIYFFLFFITLVNVNSQIPLGTWREHLPYNKVIMAVEASDRIYAATPQTLFYVDKSDNTVHKITKVDGLSDVGISSIAYAEESKSLIIAYTNTNIDLIKNDVVYNLPDIKRKIIPGRKTINNIFIKENKAYLSCGFGVVVIDLNRREVCDTWLIGPLGNQVEVFDMDIYNNKFYVATELGMYNADINNQNLANYNYWTFDESFFYFGTKLNMVCNFNNSIIVNKPGAQENTDSTFIYKNGVWNYTEFTGNAQKKCMNVYKNALIIALNYFVNEYDTTFANITNLWTYNPKNIFCNYAIIDKTGNRWICDNQHGLVKNWSQNIWKNDFFTFNGPLSDQCFQMSLCQDMLTITQGGVTGSWGNNMIKANWSYFTDNEWHNVTNLTVPQLDTIYDIISMASNPLNPSQIFAATWGKGILEFNNGQLQNTYTILNTPLESFAGGTYIGGLAIDKNGTMWCTNSNTGKILAARTPQNNWYTFNLAPYANGVNASKVFIDSSNYKWIILPRTNGLVVYNDNGTIDNPSDDEKKSLNINLGTRISTNQINCIAQDLDGSIWIGTDKGIKVFYNPESIFSTNNPAPQNILIEQDGYVQNLLEFENVSCIAVDGANQKWIGTSKAGVFVMSPDGTKELFSFTESNSPIFSNTIIDIAIHPKTGEVFIATDKGIISYRGMATSGSEYIADEVLVFPNPVRETYNGYIGINGLTRNANVKITDINGMLVYQTTANGGQAVWNGNTFSGDRAQTGVYFVFSSDTDGIEKVVAKILFIH